MLFLESFYIQESPWIHESTKDKFCVKLLWYMTLTYLLYFFIIKWWLYSFTLNCKWPWCILFNNRSYQFKLKKGLVIWFENWGELKSFNVSYSLGPFILKILWSSWPSEDLEISQAPFICGPWPWSFWRLLFPLLWCTNWSRPFCRSILVVHYFSW